MTEAGKPVLTGGCQCGAVRFAISATPNKVSICHCRMCQEASGAPFASFADVNRTDFAWTKGQPSFFRSSTIADRGYCAACGTPLSFGRIDGDRIEIMTGAFDRPDRLVPTRQYGTESRLGRWSASPICRARPRSRITDRKRWRPSSAINIRIMIERL